MRRYQAGNMKFILWLFAVVMLAACGNNNEPVKNSDPVAVTKPVVICDTFPLDDPPVKKNSVVLNVWLETTSLDWFLEKRQSAWREAKTWCGKIIPIDSNTILKCVASERKELFLHIPNHFYKKAKTGSEYFQFFIVNNTADSVTLPLLDAVINNISSSVKNISKDSAGNWLSFQQTSKMIGCGNSIRTMKLPPQTALAAEIESDFLNLGNEPLDYRIELTLGKQKIVSNTIGIHLMKKQLPFLGKDFD